MDIEFSGANTSISTIRFGENDTTINEEGKKLLDTLIVHYSAILKECPDLVIGLSCHSDSRERKQSDTLLSCQRGLVVRNYLAYHGIDPSQLFIESHGGTQPLCPEEANGKDSPECRQLDRRVEIKIIKCE